MKEVYSLYSLSKHHTKEAIFSPYTNEKMLSI